MSIPGSHLEKLYHLRKRIDDEIRIEERRAGKRAAERGQVKKKRAPSNVPTVEQRAKATGTSSHEVREWAISHGLLQAGRPGRLSGKLLDQFLAERDQTAQTAQP